MVAVKEFRSEYSLDGKIANEEDRNARYLNLFYNPVKHKKSDEEVIYNLRKNTKYTLEDELMMALGLPRRETSFLGGGPGWSILGSTRPGIYINLLSGLEPREKFRVLGHEVAHNLRPDITNETEIDRIGHAIEGLILDMMKNLDERYAVRNSYN